MLNKSRNNFAHRNNLHFFQDLSGPTFHKEITCGMLKHIGSNSGKIISKTSPNYVF